MAKKVTATVNGVEYTLQSVSPTFYYGLSDRCRISGGGQRDSVQYMDELFKNVVIAPRDVATKGMAFFDETDDIATPAALIAEIESFLAGRGKYAGGQKTSEA